MNIHVCKQCGASFVYCRACTFRPIRYKENGFCSRECYEASKNVVVPVVEAEVIEEVVVAEKPNQSDEIIEEEIEAEAIVAEEISVIETSTVVEPTIKNETNTYKKKKNKYKVHE